MITGLTREGCLERQRLLSEALRNANLDAAVITQAGHVHYLTGHWTRQIFPAAVLVRPDAQAVTTLVSPFRCLHTTACDIEEHYVASKAATIVDCPMNVAIEHAVAGLPAGSRIGFDDCAPAGLPGRFELVDIGAQLRSLRRRKHADEIAMLRHCVAACEAAYARARQVVKPGLTEIDLYAECLAAATRSAREPIGEFGNDFQSGTPGGPPRDRPMQAGELLVLDLTAPIRSYHADLCRTFAVDGTPSAAQRQAHRLIMQAFAAIEPQLRPGTSCRELHEQAIEMLGQNPDYKFTHHLGHGIGLFPHESPRLNHHWNDVLQVGDVFTLEPGLYGQSLRGGIRIEENYVITPTGFERLSSFPTEL